MINHVCFSPSQGGERINNDYNSLSRLLLFFLFSLVFFACAKKNLSARASADNTHPPPKKNTQKTKPKTKHKGDRHDRRQRPHHARRRAGAARRACGRRPRPRPSLRQDAEQDVRVHARAARVDAAGSPCGRDGAVGARARAAPAQRLLQALSDDQGRPPRHRCVVCFFVCVCCCWGCCWEAGEAVREPKNSVSNKHTKTPGDANNFPC